jgi:hypothetical protein
MVYDQLSMIKSNHCKFKPGALRANIHLGPILFLLFTTQYSHSVVPAAIG